MVAEATTIYFVNAFVLLLGALAIAAFAFRESGGARRMILISTIPAASMGVAYALMGLEVATYETAGREQSAMRFVGYTVALASFAYILKRTASLSTRQTTLLAVLLVGTPWASFVSWFLTGALESAATLLSLGLFASVSYLMYSPLDRRATAIGGRNELLYAKLRNLFIITYLTLVITSAASEQVLGLLTTFVATIAAGYADVVLTLGIGLLIVSSASLFRDRAVENATTPERPLGAAGLDE